MSQNQSTRLDRNLSGVSDIVFAQRPASDHHDGTAPLRLAGERNVDTAVFAYAVFAFIASTTAFKLFGLTTAAYAFVYLAGSLLIAYSAPRLIARPGTLLLALLFPAFALCSTFWSVDPSTTLRHAVQLLFTALIGASIGSRLTPHNLFVAMATATVTLTLLSVANLWLQVVPPFQQRDYLVGAEYFTGIFAHKNTLGLVLCLTALSLTYMAFTPRPAWPFVAGTLALFPVFLFARSTTSIALYGSILCMPVAYLLLRARLPRAMIFLVLLCALLVIAIALELLSVSLIDVGLELAGKGRDMNGRTSLWAIAVEQIAERPWFGVGYQIYWTSPRFVGDVNMVRGILEPSIAHFHNAWLETLVGTGMAGLLAIAAVPVALAIRYLYRFRRTDCTVGDVAGFFFVALVLARANVEATLVFQHQIENIALCALLFSTAGRSSAAVASDTER